MCHGYETAEEVGEVLAAREEDVEEHSEEHERIEAPA